MIAVAATDNTDTRAWFSNYGPQIELSAPGVGVNSTTIDGGYSGDTWSGTSMATPHVTGAVALLLTTSVPTDYDTIDNGQWDPAEVRLRLQDTATDLGAAGKDNYYGYGLVNAKAAVEATSPEPIPEDTIPPVISLIGSDTVIIEVGDIYVDAGATAYDNNDGDLTNSIVTVNNVINTTVGTYAVTYDVTDLSGNQATQVVRTVNVKNTIAPEGDSNMHISDITMDTGSRTAGRNTFTWALATVTVVDSNETPVPNAVVSGTWSGVTSDSDIGTTDAEGKVTVQSDIIKVGGMFTFTVNNVALTGWTYDESANVEDSDSITV